MKETNCAIFYYEESDEKLVERLSNYLEEPAKKVFEFFSVSEKPSIHIVNSKEQFKEQEGKWPIGFCASNLQIYFLSFSLVEMEEETYQKEVLHELVHYANRVFCKNNQCEPTVRFLTEGIALYFSGERVEKPLTASLEELLTSYDCYEDWYLVIKYILENNSKEMVLELVKDRTKAENYLKEHYQEIRG